MIIAVASHKGGIGNTASSLSLAAAFAGQGRTTLLVDTDPQGAGSISLGIDPEALPATLYDVLLGQTPAQEVILPTEFGFDLAPSNIDPAEAELALASTSLREYVHRRRFGAVLKQYDAAEIDAPPTLGVLTIDASAAADAVLTDSSGDMTPGESIRKRASCDIRPDFVRQVANGR